jgi:LPXTG-site transpeptidase (sortase) family protein
MRAFRLLAVVAATALAACGSGGERAVPRPAPPVTSAPPRASDGAALADGVVELDSARYDAREHNRVRPLPARIEIAELRIDGAPVVAVGVEPSGELEVPATAVGWYRFGPSPGEPGTSVLAAHIAFGGEDGIFRRLQDLRAGDEVTVTTAAGERIAYTVEAVDVYLKTELPDDVWMRAGRERLALISCGGTFDLASRSYDSNVVAWAAPTAG